MLTLSTLLIIYWIFLAVFAIFVLINIYHLAASASLTIISFIVTFFVIAAGVATIYGTMALLQDINFQQPLLNTGSITEAFRPGQL